MNEGGGYIVMSFVMDEGVILLYSYRSGKEKSVCITPSHKFTL